MEEARSEGWSGGSRAAKAEQRLFSYGGGGDRLEGVCMYGIDAVFQYWVGGWYLR